MYNSLEVSSLNDSPTLCIIALCPILFYFDLHFIFSFFELIIFKRQVLRAERQLNIRYEVYVDLWIVVAQATCAQEVEPLFLWVKNTKDSKLAFNNLIQEPMFLSNPCREHIEMSLYRLTHRRANAHSQFY